MHSKSLLSKLTLVAAAVSATFVAPEAYSGVMHSDVSIQTYTDFGQNMGRYVVGGKVNALLEKIRENGVQITYTGGQSSYTLEHGMIDFSSVQDGGPSTALGNNFIATVRHNNWGEVAKPTFTSREVGSENAICYKTVEYCYEDNAANTVFSLSPTADYKIARTNKLITDVVTATVTSCRPENASDLVGETIYRSGGGLQRLADHEGNQTVIAGGYQYLTGGIMKIEGATYEAKSTDGRGATDDSFRFSYTLESDSWSSAGITEENPLPIAGWSGDSGSPVWIWNEKTQAYEYLAAFQSADVTNASGFTMARGATEWTTDTMEYFYKDVKLTDDSGAAINEVTINAVSSTSEGSVTCEIQEKTGNYYYGTVTSTSGVELAKFAGVKGAAENESPLYTWKSLTELKDTRQWYAYGDEYFNSDISTEDLFLTENLRFKATSDSTIVNVGADVDLGIGYVEFTKGERSEASFTVRSANNHMLNSAGYVVGEGVKLYLNITNSDADYMREWRKVGAGDLYLTGSGKNEIFLNLGGVGTTYLQSTSTADGGYAAYNVLVNTGAKVVIKDVNQIARDFTFGAGGGTLDMNGNSMEWNNGNSMEWNNGNRVAADGFTIHALTEEAVITNTTGTTTLTVTTNPATSVDYSNVFLGSFKDTAEGALKVVYNGGANTTWTLHSIHTTLTKNAGSGLEVQSGTVVLSGINTIHAMGSATGTNTDRLVNLDDWHYADATMDVSVASGATFELGSHARLTGNVNVATGGTYIMREGVKHDQEYVEGGAVKEDVSQYSAFYGHHGDVSLASGAELQITYNNGVTASNEYSGNITGEGNVSVSLGTSGATLTLSGENTFSGTKTIESGMLIAGSVAALGDCSTEWIVKDAGGIAVEGLSSSEILGYIRGGGDSTGVLALMDEHSEGIELYLEKHQNLIVGALKGKSVKYGSAGKSLSAYNNQWVLGGGGGELVVLYKLSGENNLVLGNEYGTGTVTLANTENDFSGNIIFGGRVTLKYTDVKALGTATVNLTYGNRFLAFNGLENVATDSANYVSNGVLMIDSLASGTSFDLSAHSHLTLGSSGNTTLSGGLTLGENADYRFGGTTGTLTVKTELSGSRNLIVDGQTYSGGTVRLETSASLTGAVTVMGYDSTQTNLTEGDIILSFGVANALASASSVTVKDGGMIDLAGTNQTFQSLTVNSTGKIFDSAENSNATLTVGGGTIEGSVSVTNFVVRGNLTVSGTLAADTLSVSSGTLTLSGSAVELGNVNVSSGTLSTANTNYSIDTLTISGGTFDIKGQGDSLGDRIGSITLAGGTLANTVGNLDVNNKQINSLSLTADSTVNSTSRFGIIGANHGVTTLDLGNKTLTKTGSGAFDLVNTSVTAGTINVTEGNLEFSTQGKAHNSTIDASILLGENGKFNVNKNGSGTLTFSGDNTQITTLTHSAGTINFSGNSVSIDSVEGVDNGTGANIEIGKDSKVEVANDFFLRYEYDGSSELNVQGTLNVGGNLVLARDGKGTAEVNGTLSVGTLHVGQNWSGDKGSIVNLNSTGKLVLGNITAGTTVPGPGEENGATGTYINASALNLKGGTFGTSSDSLTVGIDGLSVTLGEGTSSTINTGKYVDGAFTDTGTTITIGSAISGTGSLVKTGAGTLNITSALSMSGNLTVEEGTLNVSNASSSLSGNIAVARGGKLNISNGYSLDAGKTFSILATKGSTDPANFNSTLTLNGGTLVFDGAALSEDTAALHLGGLSGTNANIAFNNTSFLKAGIQYLLSDGNWSGIGISGTGSSYLTPTFSGAADCLSVSFAIKEGYSLWNGTSGSSTWDADTFAQDSGIGSNVAVFNDSAAVKEVEVSETVEAERIIFDSAQGYTFNGSGNISAGSLDITGTGRMEVNTHMSISGGLSLVDGAHLAGSGEVSVAAMSLGAGSTATFDGVTLSVTNGESFANARLLSSDSSTTTIHLDNGATFDDRGSYYRTMGALNIEGSGGTMYINGIRMVDSGKTESSLHIGDGNHLVITGDKSMTGTESGTAGSFSLSHWNAKSTVSIDGTLTSNAVISSWDSRDASVNVNSGGALNLLAGLSRNNRSIDINVNVASGAAVYAKGGNHHNNLKVNLAAGATLGGIADVAGGTVSFTNNMTLGTAGETGTITIDTDLCTAGADYLLTKGTGGTIALNGTLTFQENTSLNVVGSGTLSVGQGLNMSGSTVVLAENSSLVLGGGTSESPMIHSIGTLNATGTTVTLAENASLTVGGFVDGGAQFFLNSGSNLMLNNAGTIAFNNLDTDVGAMATGSGTVTIGNGTIVQLTNLEQKKVAAVAGTIEVQGGGCLYLSGGKSLLGYDDGGTDAVYLVGSEGMLATMHITSKQAQHLSTDLHLQGNAQVTGDGFIESYQHGDDGMIYAEGTNNTIAASINLNRTLTVVVESDAELNVIGTIGNADDGSKNIIKTGEGTLTLTGANTYSGTTTVSAGTLIVKGVNSGNGNVVIESGAVVDVSSEGGSLFSRENGSGSSVTVRGTLKVLEYDWSATGSLGKLRNNRNLVTVDGGNIVFVAKQKDVLRSTTITANGGTITASKGISLSFAGNTNGNAFETAENGTLTFNTEENGNITISGGSNGIISGEGAVKKTGAGTLTLSGANTYTGTTTISEGVLKAMNVAALGKGKKGMVTVASGAELQIGVQDVVIEGGLVLADTSSKIVVDLADFASAIDAREGDSVTLTILSGATITFGAEAVAVATALATADETDYAQYLTVKDTSGKYSSFSSSWTYNERTSLTLTVSVPEPSAFGLLAGISALALCVSRRRRRK